LKDELELNPAANEVHVIEMKNEIISRINSFRYEGSGKR
jgi:hypothetical protein